MSFTSKTHVRLRGLVGAVRFAWIPAVCALVVALASEDPRGRLLAAALGLASLALGVAVHAREIVLGRAARRAAAGAVPPTTGEWLAALR
jgi:disulfide bond formation protein DsbB